MKLTDTGLTVQDIKDKVNTYMIETYERMDFLCETARDQYMYDEKGEKYLDFYAGIAVNSASNCNEKVVAAVIDQVQDVMHTFNYPYTIPQALLAEKVCTTIGMDKIFFQNSGTEANEAMIKMARKYGIEKYGPNKYHIVTAKNGFHGRTFGAMSATGQPGNGCQIGFGPMTYGFSYAPYNDLKAFKDACTENTIAIMIEPVQGEGGVHPATQEFMSGLREFCDEWSYVKKKYKLNVTNFLCSERSLTCYFYCILLDVFKILFLIFIWRQISTMTVNAYGIIKCFDVFKNQFMCMCIIKDFKPVDPFSLQKCMERFYTGVIPWICFL